MRPVQALDWLSDNPEQGGCPPAGAVASTVAGAQLMRRAVFGVGSIDPATVVIVCAVQYAIRLAAAKHRVPF